MSKNSKTQMLKKGIYTPAKAQLNAAPADKAEYTSNTENKGKFSNNPKKSNREEIMAQRDKRREKVLIRRGVNQEDIEKMDDKSVIVLCMSYGTYTVQDGVREKLVKKRNEHRKVIGKETKQIPNILRGTKAIEFTIREKFKPMLDDDTMKFLSIGSNHVFIKVAEKDKDSLIEFLNTTGRVSVYKKPWPEKPKKKEKKPSNNTEEAKKNAKNERKESKQAAKDMRPYYAARRNVKKGAPIKKAVSKRIRMHNPTLAADIEAWLAKNPVDTKKRVGHTAKKGSHQFHNNITSLQMKRSERMKKERQRIATLKKMKATQAAKMASNQAKRNTSKKPVQTELKMAA